MKKWSLVVGALLVAGNAWAQEESKVTLVAQKAIYKVGSGASVTAGGSTEGVTVTLFNGSSQTVNLSSAYPLTVKKNGVIVWAPYAILVLKPVAPGKSESFTWDKIDANTSWVKPGTYTITIGPLWLGNQMLYRSVDVALTSTGKLAGTSRFPLAVGNQWAYAFGSGSAASMKVTKKSGQWFGVKNLIGLGDRWARLNGVAQPTLLVKEGSAKPFFRFNCPVGYTYAVNLGAVNKFKVGTVNATVATPAGTFTGCYRLDSVGSYIADAGYGSFWFAPGIGLVQYSEIWIGGEKLYKLRSAKIKGSDGATYLIGQK